MYKYIHQASGTGSAHTGSTVRCVHRQGHRESVWLRIFIHYVPGATKCGWNRWNRCAFYPERRLWLVSPLSSRASYSEWALCEWSCYCWCCIYLHRAYYVFKCTTWTHTRANTFWLWKWFVRTGDFMGCRLTMIKGKKIHSICDFSSFFLIFLLVPSAASLIQARAKSKYFTDNCLLSWNDFNL